MLRNQIHPDADLIEGSICGDPKMQRLLYDRYQRKMYGICLRYACCAEEANDFFQEGFIKIFSRISDFRGEGPLEAWMRRIFTNTAIEHLRKKTKTYLQPITEAEEDTIEDNDLAILEALSEKEIINLIQTLPPGYRTVFNLRAVEGYMHKEIGKILGISEGTSKSQYARARNLLRKQFEDNKKKNSNRPR